jgi:gas vesicle protein
MANSSSKVLIAAIAGVAAGIGIGILIAPAKGSKTRKRLKKRIMGMADFMQTEMEDKFSTFKSVFGDSEVATDQNEEPIKGQKETT